MSIKDYNQAVAKTNPDAKLPAQRSIADLGKVLASKFDQIKSVVASTVTPQKMARIALNELRLNDYLAKVAMSNPDSFINAVVQASHLGLEIGGALGQCYLVPYKSEVKAIVGYRGLLTLARRSGFITSIKAEMVYENDTFDLELGIETKVVHKPLLTGDRGKPKLVYMVAHFTDGGYHFEWMSIGEVDKIRARSPSGKAGPWVTDYEQMALKTVIRRGWKYLPMSIEMMRTEQIEAAQDAGQKVSFVVEGDAVEISTGKNESPDSDSIKTMISNATTEADMQFIKEIIAGLDEPAQTEMMAIFQAKQTDMYA
jgi:recombination protein RecT